LIREDRITQTNLIHENAHIKSTVQAGGS